MRYFCYSPFLYQSLPFVPVSVCFSLPLFKLPLAYTRFAIHFSSSDLHECPFSFHLSPPPNVLIHALPTRFAAFHPRRIKTFPHRVPSTTTTDIRFKVGNNPILFHHSHRRRRRHSKRSSNNNKSATRPRGNLRRPIRFAL